MPEEASTSRLGRKPIPLSLVKERRDYMARLHLGGASFSNILTQVNKQAEGKGWGSITLQQVHVDISTYYRQNANLGLQDTEYIAGLREANLKRLDRIIEEMNLIYLKKKRNNDWKPFEESDFMDKLYKMQKEYMEIQDWDLSKKNVGLVSFNVNANGMISAFDSSQQDLLTMPKSVKFKLLKLIEEEIENRKEGAEQEIIDVEIIDNKTIKEAEEYINKFKKEND